MKTIIAISNGFETLEALTSYDLLKRCDLDVILASCEKTLDVISSHNLSVKADMFLKDIVQKEVNIFIIPGGLENAKTLSKDKNVISLAKHVLSDETKVLASICASPSLVLSSNDIALDRDLTCYPGCELKREFSKEKVVVDKNLITAQGAGNSIEFTYAIIEKVFNKEKVNVLRKSIRG